MRSSATFGRFAVQSRIGVGGMGEVFRARDRGQPVALKLMRPELATDERHRELFLAEARVGAALAHPNLVQQLDYGEERGVLWLAMELVDGASLDRILAAGPLSAPAAAHVALELLAALDYVHQRGLVHRDVSASNVLVSRAGEVKLSDFGVAKVRGPSQTRPDELKGKPAYMAPEALHTPGTPVRLVDRRADLFALGVVLFRMTMGHAPFADVAQWLRSGAPLQASGPLASVTVRALAPDPDQRYASAREMAQAIATRRLSTKPARAELRARVGDGGERESPMADVDKLIIAALAGDAVAPEKRQRTAPLALAPPASSELDEPTRPRVLADPGSAQVTTVRARAGEPPPPSRLRTPLMATVAMSMLVAVLAILHRAPRRPPLEMARTSEPSARTATSPSGHTDDARLVSRPSPPGPAADPRVSVPRPSVPAPVSDAQLDRPSSPATRVARTQPTRIARRVAAPPEPGWLTLDTQPWGTVYLDGKRIGTTPFARRQLPAGRHRLTIDVEDSGRRRPLVVAVAPHLETRLALDLRTTSASLH